MAKLGITKISLARKCQILFGAAVLSSIAASLFIPGLQMNNLTEQRYLQTAKEAATIALLRAPLNDDWAAAQDNLARDWPTLSRLGEGEFSARVPRMMGLAEAEDFARAAPEGFIAESVNQLKNDRQAVYRWKLIADDRDRTAIRLAMAVRAQEGDPDPGALRGLIDVEVPIPPKPCWSTSRCWLRRWRRGRCWPSWCFTWSRRSCCSHRCGICGEWPSG
jgi:hypothetical protein